MAEDGAPQFAAVETAALRLMLEALIGSLEHQNPGVILSLARITEFVGTVPGFIYGPPASVTNRMAADRALALLASLQARVPSATAQQ